MNNFSRNAFEEHLAALGISQGDAIAVHARLLTFGRIEGGVETVFEVLCQAVGENGTLVFPSYTLELSADDVFHPQATPAQGMGSLPEYVRRSPKAQRTLCPLHSHVVIGPQAPALLNADPTRSIGPGSAFEVMLDHRFKLLLLGCTAHEGATVIHHVEANVGVPYREWITLERSVAGSDGSVRTMQCPYYGRRQDQNVRTDLTLADRVIRSLPEANVLSVGNRHSVFVPLAAVDRAIRDLLKQDPFALIERSGLEAAG